jgi:hypothetical protein
MHDFFWSSSFKLKNSKLHEFKTSLSTCGSSFNPLEKRKKVIVIFTKVKIFVLLYL